MKVLGIMSGTSMDGVDYALCDITRTRCELLDLWSVDYPKPLRARVHACADGRSTSHELARLHHELGRFYATHAQMRRRSASAELVGLHGQTIFHEPIKARPSTLQIGEPAWLVEHLKVPVIHNFRAADLAAGGQGAPLATAFHLRVFARKNRHVCINNLGGISNVTSLNNTKPGSPMQIMAFDTGPANVLIDLAAHHCSRGRLAFDRDGRMAAGGKPHLKMVDSWLGHPFFRKAPPKSTGRELFGEAWFENAKAGFVKPRMKTQDILATLTEFTARSIALNYELHLSSAPDEVILCGGGAANPTLVSMLASALEASFGRVKVTSSEDHGWPLKSVEPAAFALLAWQRWHGVPGNIPETTGARHDALLGSISARPCKA